MLVVDEMKIVGTKYLAPRCKQVKVLLDGVSYKRISFEYNDDVIHAHWMSGGDYVSDSREKILEKIFSQIESK